MSRRPASRQTDLPGLPAHLQPLFEAASTARTAAYAPYSGFPVGAALEADDGSIHPGCNVENATFGATVCAERSAVSAAVGSGRRHFSRVVVVAEPIEGRPVQPCGICRQVLAEFGLDLEVIVCDPAGQLLAATRLSKLLPSAFRLR